MWHTDWTSQKAVKFIMFSTLVCFGNIWDPSHLYHPTFLLSWTTLPFFLNHIPFWPSMKFRKGNIVPNQKCQSNGWERQTKIPLGKMSGGFLNPIPNFILEDNDSLSRRECYVLHSLAMYACKADIGIRRGHNYLNSIIRRRPSLVQLRSSFYSPTTVLFFSNYSQSFAFSCIVL